MLLELVIAQACIGLSGQPHEACLKAVQAASIQYGVSDSVGNAEKVVTKTVESKVSELTGPKALAVIAFTAKVVHDKQVAIQFSRSNGKMPSVVTTFDRTSGRVLFGWGF